VKRLLGICIVRPIGASLLATGLLFVGLVAYLALPVASLPLVDSPLIVVQALRPGADPKVMAASVTAPLERSLGAIPGVKDISSQSWRGFASISVRFDGRRSSDKAALDVQAAINAAAPDLPEDMPYLPWFSKTDAASNPVLLLALTSDSMTPGEVYDAADSIVLQQLSEISGVGQVILRGGQQPAVRVQIDTARLAAMGLSAEAVRAALVEANAPSALGEIDGADGAESIAMRYQLTRPQDYRALVIARRRDASVVQLGDVADVEVGVRDNRSAAWFNGKPAIIMSIAKKPEANVIETVDAVRARLAAIRKLIPAAIAIDVFVDRTSTIRSAVSEIQRALMISVSLVMAVVLAFLRRIGLALAAGVAIPLSFAGTFALMWLWGFSINISSLLALVVSVGFVVDDAVVMIEKISRSVDAGASWRRAALSGVRKIGFTILAISAALVAAFAPMMVVGGEAGRILREFSVTLAFAVAMSALVSLTVTPMILSRMPKARMSEPEGWPARMLSIPIAAVERGYSRSVGWALSRPWTMLVVTIFIIAAAARMYYVTPKGLFPVNDGGFVVASTEASADVSPVAMINLQQRAAAVARADPAVATVAANTDGGDKGEIDIFLKPLEQRGFAATSDVMARLRLSLSQVEGLTSYVRASREFGGGAGPERSAYQFALTDENFDELREWSDRIVKKLSATSQLTEVSSDRNATGLQAYVHIDREAAARQGVTVTAIDEALADGFSQRPVSIVYGARNQYRVVLEAKDNRGTNPESLPAQVFVPNSTQSLSSLASLATVDIGSSPLAVNHQASLPAMTISYNSAPGVSLGAATEAVRAAIDEMHPPVGLKIHFNGLAKILTEDNSIQGGQILLALLAIYVVLGVLYESLLHPLTIMSTLPSAGLGGLIVMRIMGLELNYLTFIGLTLLIGIVQKNSIMIVDFAIGAVRAGVPAEEAIREACAARFRPILMTTITAMLGAAPLVMSRGAGAEYSYPLGATVLGGLSLSQLVTLYTAPAIYLLMSRASKPAKPLLP
jgi:multidrug efflux pump